MIIIYSDTHCNRCRGIEVMLQQRGVEYEKILMSDLPADEYIKIVEMAKDAGSLALPVIIRDGKIVPISELL